MRTGLLLILALCFSSAAQAQAKSSVVVDAPKGLFKLVESGLGQKYEAVLAPKPLSDVPLTKEIRAATEASHAIAVFLVRPIASGYSLQVLSAADGTPLDTIELAMSRKKPLKIMPKPAAKQLLAALREARAPQSASIAEPPPQPPPETPMTFDPEPTIAAPSERREPVAAQPAAPMPVAVTEPAVAAAPIEAAKEPAAAPVNPDDFRTALRASFGFRGANRSLTWDASKTEALSNYSAPFAPAISVGLTVFPAAGFTTGFIANVGLTTQADIVVGLASQPIDDTVKFGTQSVRYRLGALVRLPTSKTFELQVGAGYSSQTFSVAAVSADGAYSRPQSPGVAFNGPRLSFGLLLTHLGPASIDLAVGAVIPVGKGELSTTEFFPKASAFGLDVAAGVSFEIASHFELRVGADYARYFITANADAASALQAKTGADQYIAGSLSLVFVL